MAYAVGPTENNPTHVFSLSDGTNTKYFLTCDNRGNINPQAGFSQAPMPRTAMKLSQGAAKYEDFELPFTSIIQQDFSGGMNAKDFEDDRTKYRDCRHCDTIRGNVVCGPKETKTSLVSTDGDLTSEGYHSETTTSFDQYASKYTPANNVTVTRIKIFVRDRQAAGTAYVGIYSDSSGPNTLLASGSQYSIGGGGIIEITLDAPESLTKSTIYWIAAYYNHSTLTECCYHAASGIMIYKHEVGVGWVFGYGNQSIAYDLVISIQASNFRFFQHRRCLYVIASYDNGSTQAKLYQNGYRGAAKSNSANKTKLNTNLDLSVDMNGDALDLINAVALIIEGPGAEEEQPWRRISANTNTGANDVITVTKPWKITHTAATSFVILNTDDWWEIGTTGFGTKITDVEIVYDYVAIAQGDAKNIRKFRWYNNSGTGTNTFVDDGQNRFDLLLMVADTEGAMQLWSADIDNNTVDYAPAQYYATNHTFINKDIKIGTSIYDDIKNMIAYGDPLIPYIIKEDSFGSIQNDVYAEIPLGELAAIRSEYNGLAAMKHNVYLYFNIGERIERYYDRRLDDIGPTKDEGLLEERRGIVRKLLPYPGRYYALISSEERVPSILCNNGIGWNEIWRPTSVTSDGSGATGEDAPFAYNVSGNSGARANDMIVQEIPGKRTARLWFDCAGEILYIPIEINPETSSYYYYRDLSQIETAWYYGNLKDINKYWHSIKLHTEGLSGTDRSIKIEYKVDNDTSWTHVGVVETSPIQELELSSSYDVTGYRIKFRLTLHTVNPSYTPELFSIVIKGVIRVDVKKGWSVRIVTNSKINLNDKEDSQGNHTTQLDTWADSEKTPAPITLRHNITYYDNSKVFIDPASLSFLMVELTPTPGSSNRNYREVAEFLMYEV